MNDIFRMISARLLECLTSIMQKMDIMYDLLKVLICDLVIFCMIEVRRSEEHTSELQSLR